MSEGGAGDDAAGDDGAREGREHEDREREGREHEAGRFGFDPTPVEDRRDLALVEGDADVDDLDAFLDELGGIGDAEDCVVQAFDAGLVAGERHLARAADCARRAIERGEAIAREPAVEVLCYAAGRRQIEDALELGLGEGRQPAVVLVAALDAGNASAADATERDVEAAAEAVRELVEPAPLERGSELAAPGRLASYFDVTDAERAASDADLETLVCERVALLVVER